MRPQITAGQEAAALAGVAGGSDLIDLDQEGVAVAVQMDGLDVLRVSGRVPLAPVLAPRPLPEGHSSLFQGAPERFIAHPPHHEDLM